MSDDIVERLREDELRLGRAAFDSAGAGLSCNLASEAADEIERLRAELAAERERNEDLTTVYMFAFEKGQDAIRAERDAVRAQLAEAREALEPFVALERIGWVGTKIEGGKDEDAVVHHYNSDTKVTLGDFRRARAVLEKIKGGGDEKTDL